MTVFREHHSYWFFEIAVFFVGFGLKYCMKYVILK